MRFLIFLTMISSLVGAPLELVITAERHQAMPLRVIVDETMQNHMYVDYLGSLLGATKQFEVDKLFMAEPHTKKEMKLLAQEGFPLALFISGNEKECVWRLYDTMNALLIKGKKNIRKKLSDAQWAIFMADQIWPELTSQEGSFSSLIAVCKDRSSGKKRCHRDLYLIHPFYTFEQFKPIKLVKRGNNFAPRWHRHRSVIFYSQHTLSNVRLMSIDSDHTSRIITSFEGQNMTPALSSEGRVVLALSSNDHTQLYEYIFNQQKKKGSFIRLTHKVGDFISPSFLKENELVFCYVNDRNVPQLGIMNLSDKTIKWLKVGRALCPAVSPTGGQLAYCKKVSGFYQIFIYDMKTSVEQQLTRDKGHKDECSWSPCGNYIACSLEQGDESSICLVDVNTRAVRYLTSKDEHWSYPSWSPRLILPFSYAQN